MVKGCVDPGPLTMAAYEGCTTRSRDALSDVQVAFFPGHVYIKSASSGRVDEGDTMFTSIKSAIAWIESGWNE